MPNCTNVSWTTDNIASKNIRLALVKVNLIPLVGSPEVNPLAVKLLDNRLYILNFLNIFMMLKKV